MRLARIGDGAADGESSLLLVVRRLKAALRLLVLVKRGCLLAGRVARAGEEGLLLLARRWPLALLARRWPLALVERRLPLALLARRFSSLRFSPLRISSPAFSFEFSLALSTR